MKVYKEEMVCLNEIIEKNSDFFYEQAKAKNLTIKKKISEKVLVKQNPDLAEILINNLFLNTFIPNMNNGNYNTYKSVFDFFKLQTNRTFASR
jgi:hypothetical protein